jgi:hypothetical protein
VKDRTTGSLAAVAGGLVILYVLSPPFVAWACMKAGLNDVGSVVRVFYAPLIQLYECFPPYKALMDALFKILLP